MPGHGTVPAGLATSGSQDWTAAVRLGVRHVRARIGNDRPLVLVGYSNGGALVTRYTLDALEEPTLPEPDRLVLVSPMIGVTRAARLASVISALGFVRYFEKARWLDVVPGIQPVQVQLLSRQRRTPDLRRHARPAPANRAGGADGRLKPFPPVLTFQSLVDATVSTQAIVSTYTIGCPLTATNSYSSTSIVSRTSTPSSGPTIRR